MKKKVWKLFSLLMALMVMTSVLTACGSGSDEAESGDYEEEAYTEEGADYDLWIGNYSSGSGTLTIDYSGGMLYYAMGASTEDGASAISGTLTEGSDPYLMEDEDFIFSYDTSDDSIEVMLQDDGSEYGAFTGWYYYEGPVDGGISSEDTGSDDMEAASDGLGFWYGDYEGDNGTLTISESLEDMIDVYLSAYDGAMMSGTMSMYDGDPTIMEDRELYVIYHEEDGSIEVTGKTAADDENNASFIGMYYPG